MKAEPFVHARINFNPRSCTRSDARHIRRNFQYGYFNPRSCTRSDGSLLVWAMSLLYFNPRSCTRSDRRYSGEMGSSNAFQPTLLHEERPEEGIF